MAATGLKLTIRTACHRFFSIKKEGGRKAHRGVLVLFALAALLDEAVTAFLGVADDLCAAWIGRLFGRQVQ